MSTYRLRTIAIAVAAAALAWTASPAVADTPRDAPEPQLSDSQDSQVPDSQAPPAADSEEPVPDTEVPPAVDDEDPPAPPTRAVAPRSARLHRPASRYRRGKGWFLGASLGVGSVTYSDGSSDGATATFFDARLGGMLTPRLGLSAEFWSDGHRNKFDDSLAITQNSLGVCLAYWTTPHLWLKAGLGTARVTMYRGGTELARHHGVVYTASAGYEIVSRDSLALDISLRLLGSTFDASSGGAGRSALSLHAGVTWY